MIRINLLGFKKEVSKQSRMPTISMEGAKATMLCVAIVALAVLALGYDYWRVTGEKAALDKALGEAQAESKRLARVKTEYDQFQTATQALEKRINIIEGLKKSQTGPVTLLNTIASTVESSGPLWLTSFDNSGDKITMTGTADNVNTVADFITKLRTCGQFKNVEIKESYQDNSIKDVPTFYFSITAELATAPAAGGKS
jgi:Tfp pilus assembly protein PilN